MSKNNKKPKLKPTKTPEKIAPVVRNPIILALHAAPKRGGAHGTTHKAKRQNDRQTLRLKLKDHENLDHILSDLSDKS